MVPDILSDARGLPGLATLLLLPGLLVARAPWSAVPFLSSGFWIVSWWWLPHLGLGRERFLRGALLVFLVLALLRLRKPTGASVPSWPVVLVSVAALARLIPFALWPVAPGADMSLHSLSTLLMLRRDGLPVSYEPLLPIRTFGAYTPGLHALAADLALLSGIPADRAAFLVSTAANGLLQIALFTLLVRFFPRGVAALAAVLALGMARVPQSFFGWGGNPSVLALAFLVAAGALLARDRSRAACAAAGLFLGCAVIVHAMIATAALACVPLITQLLWRAPSGRRRERLVRLALAGGVALLAAGPFLLSLDFTLSPSEHAWLADHLRTHYAADWMRYASSYPLALLRYVLASVNDAFLAASLVGLAVGVRRRSAGLVGLGAAAALLVALAGTARWGGLGPLVFFPERPLALLAVLLAAGLGFLVETLARRGGVVAALALVALGGVAVERSHRYYFGAGDLVMVSEEDLEAMAWLRANSREGDLVCNDYRTSGIWIPALAGRAISVPHLPPFYFEEFREGSAGRSCAYTYVSERWFFGRAEPRDHREPLAFENASVRIHVGGEVRSSWPPAGPAVP